MKKLLFAISAMAIMLSSCSEEPTTNTTITGRFVGSGVDSIFLERITDKFDKAEKMGAVALQDDGSFSFDLTIAEEESPRFYRLAFSDESRPVTLVVAPGDQIKLESAGNIFLNYSVEGSEESALIAQFSHDYFASVDELANIAENQLPATGNSRQLELRAYELAREAMLKQMRFVGSHQDCIASIYALHHRVAEQYIPQLEGQGINIVHYNSVLEGVKGKYPTSPYVDILERKVKESEAFARVLEGVQEVSYPDLELMDICGTKHKLSDLEGKVVLLYFWSVHNAKCNNLNADLKALYNEYHDKGFEIYHVSVDADKDSWVLAINAQNLPWSSLYTGGDVRVVELYNVEKIPTTYIINREGDITAVEENIENIKREVKRLI
jgi:peroxiredoxin